MLLIRGAQQSQIQEDRQECDGHLELGNGWGVSVWKGWRLSIARGESSVGRGRCWIHDEERSHVCTL